MLINKGLHRKSLASITILKNMGKEVQSIKDKLNRGSKDDIRFRKLCEDEPNNISPDGYECFTYNDLCLPNNTNRENALEA